MSGLADLRQRRARLQDISGIVTAMKSLSLVESRKLARRVEHQQRVRRHIAQVAADFLRAHPAFAAPARGRGTVLVVIGSERGFCGRFNDRIVQALQGLQGEAADATWLLVGRRLGQRLPDGARIRARLEGATVGEDVPAVVDRVLDALRTQPSSPDAAPAVLAALGHDEQGEPVLTRLLPLPPPPPGPVAGTPPRLQLPVAAFHHGLLEQHLFASLHGLLYASLAAESHQRLAHMEQALDRLGQTLHRLTLRGNAMRQELIVEEIEVLLSSAMAAAQRGEPMAGSHARARP